MTVGMTAGAVRRVKRKVTRHDVERPLPQLSANSNIDRDIRTLTKRFRSLQPGESLYPWAHTKLRIANGKREWVAK